MQLVIICHEFESHLHLDNFFASFLMLNFFLLNSVKFSTRKVEGESTLVVFFHPDGLDCVLVSFCFERVFCALPPR